PPMVLSFSGADQRGGRRSNRNSPGLRGPGLGCLTADRRAARWLLSEKQPSMKILVTGSSGHLGEALVRTLRNKNREVIGVDIVGSEFTNEVGSILDRPFVKRCMESADAVIHTATLHKPHVITHSRQSF